MIPTQLNSQSSYLEMMSSVYLIYYLVNLEYPILDVMKSNENYLTSLSLVAIHRAVSILR